MSASNIPTALGMLPGVNVVDTVAEVEERDPALLVNDLLAAALGCERIGQALDALGGVHGYPEHAALLRKAAAEIARLRAIEQGAVPSGPAKDGHCPRCRRAFIFREEDEANLCAICCQETHTKSREAEKEIATLREKLAAQIDSLDAARTDLRIARVTEHAPSSRCSRPPAT